MIADAQSTGKEIEIPVFISINKAGSFWNVEATKNKEEGKKLREARYQNKKGNIPSLRNKENEKSTGLLKKYDTKIKKEDKDWTKK